MSIIIADVSLEHIDISLNLFVFELSFLLKSMVFKLLMKINKYLPKQLQILFIVYVQCVIHNSQ